MQPYQHCRITDKPNHGTLKEEDRSKLNLHPDTLGNRQHLEGCPHWHTGKIGLPDLQRPFAWKSNKVRGLLNSMLKGYTIGYIMLWKASSDTNDKAAFIGTVGKTHKAPKELVVDGQTVAPDRASQRILRRARQRQELQGACHRHRLRLY